MCQVDVRIGYTDLVGELLCVLIFVWLYLRKRRHQNPHHVTWCG